MVEVTEEEVKNSVKVIPSWTTVVRGWDWAAVLAWGRLAAGPWFSALPDPDALHCCFLCPSQWVSPALQQLTSLCWPAGWVVWISCW